MTTPELKRLKRTIADLKELIDKKNKKINKLHKELIFLDNQVLDMLYWYETTIEELDKIDE